MEASKAEAFWKVIPAQDNENWEIPLSVLKSGGFTLYQLYDDFWEMQVHQDYFEVNKVKKENADFLCLPGEAWINEADAEFYKFESPNYVGYAIIKKANNNIFTPFLQGEEYLLERGVAL
jgi:hypothetical protein